MNESRLTMDRYILLYENNAHGANLAPVDFRKMQEFENMHGIDSSDCPSPEVMKHRLTLLSKQH